MQLYNDSNRNFMTTKGLFKQKATIDFSEAESKKLLEYAGIKDAQKMFTPLLLQADIEALKAENAVLKIRLQAYETVKTEPTTTEAPVVRRGRPRKEG